jgi:hypothetical protein
MFISLSFFGCLFVANLARRDIGEEWITGREESHSYISGLVCNDADMA